MFSKFGRRVLGVGIFLGADDKRTDAVGDCRLPHQFQVFFVVSFCVWRGEAELFGN